MCVTWMSDFIQGLKYGQFTANEAEVSDAQDCQISTAVKNRSFSHRQTEFSCCAVLYILYNHI